MKLVILFLHDVQVLVAPVSPRASAEDQNYRGFVQIGVQTEALPVYISKGEIRDLLLHLQQFCHDLSSHLIA